MSPKDAASGGDDRGRIEIGDIRAKLQDISGDAKETTQDAKPLALYAGIGGFLVIIIIAFLLGKKRGVRKATWVEIRRL